MKNIDEIMSREVVHDAVRIAFDVGFVAVGALVWNATRNPVLRFLGSVVVCDAINRTSIARRPKGYNYSGYSELEEQPKKKDSDFKMGFQ